MAATEHLNIPTYEQFAQLLTHMGVIADSMDIIEDAQEMSYTAEAWAVGTKNGIDVGSSDPQYHNNAKYYKEQAEAVAESIPEDYSELSDDVDQLKNALITDTASGTIASFPDGADNFPMRDLTVQMEPIQDLHGYDSPWPAGGGKNKLNLSLSSMKSRNSSWSWNENVATYSGITITVYADESDNVTGIKADGQNNSGTYLRFAVDVPTLTKDVTYTLSGAPSGYSGTQATIYLGNSPTTIGIQNQAIENGVPVTFTPTQTGAPNANINFNANVSVSNAMFYPMIEVGSSATSFEPTSNVCPISGWTGCNVSRTRKNLLPMTVDGIKAANTGTWSGNSYTTYGVTFTIQTDSDGNVAGIMINGTNSSNSNAELNLYANNSFYLPNGDYVLNGAYSDPCRIFFYTGKRYYDSKPNPVSFTIDGTETVSRCTVAVTKNTTVNNAVVYPMIRLASDADPTYEPSQSKDISITFQASAGTVYGGTVDVTTGVLTVTMAEVDLGTLSWNASSRYGMYSDDSKLRDYIKKPSSNAEKVNAITSFKQVIDWTTFFNPGTPTANTCSVNTSGAFGVSTTETDPAAFKQSVSGQQLVYELATPQTYQLTPQQVTTLLGKNNIWSDADSVSVDYVADAKLYIDKELESVNTLRSSIAPVEDGATASQAYAQGKYFFHNGNFCKAKTAIASGATFTLNTNYEVTTVAAELFTAINS